MIAQALDASLLDADLHSLLKEQLRNGLKWLNPTLIEDISPDFRAIVKSIIYYYLVWPSSRSATYSQRLLGLRYSQTGRAQLSPTRNQKSLFFVLSILLPWAFERATRYISKRQWSEADDIRKHVWNLCNHLETAIKALSFIQFLAFLGSRNYQTLAERLTGILLVSSSVYRQSTADFDLLNEQLIWNALADSFIFLRPFIQTHLRSIRQRIFETPDPILASLPADICAFCYQRKENACKISIPTRMQSCGHVFCYYCAAKGKQTGSPCPRCQSSVSGIELVPN